MHEHRQLADHAAGRAGAHHKEGEGGPWQALLAQEGKYRGAARQYPCLLERVGAMVTRLSPAVGPPAPSGLYRRKVDCWQPRRKRGSCMQQSRTIPKVGAISTWHPVDWVFASLIAFAIYIAATNISIVPDREVWVTERLGTRRFVSHGLRFIFPFGLEKVICKIPTQPQLVEISGERFNIPDGTCSMVASFEYKVARPEIAYERILTEEASKRLNIHQHIRTLFISAARDTVKKLPIESLCEEEEDNALSSSLRNRIEHDLRTRGLELFDGGALKVQSIALDGSAEEARRIRYQALKRAAAKAIYAQGEAQAVQQLIELLGVTQREAISFYSELEMISNLGAGGNVVVSDLLGSGLLRMGRKRGF
jgi:regulator of protease activity HflC (stomatin/prohibitin superfamily)